MMAIDQRAATAGSVGRSDSARRYSAADGWGPGNSRPDASLARTRRTLVSSTAWRRPNAKTATAAARAIAARIWDRTPGTAPPVQMANQLGMVFSRLDCTPRWRERLPEIEVPALVVHGRRDPFFPVGNGEAIAREIPRSRLLVLEEAATAIPEAAAGEVAEAMLTLG